MKKFIYAVLLLLGLSIMNACEKEESKSRDNVEFKDANFKAYCVTYFDKDGDGEISFEEAAVIKEVSVNGFHLISSLAGIEHFTALNSLECRGTGISTLDVSKNTALTFFACSGNKKLTALDVSKNMVLTYLDCSNNQLITLDVSKNTALKELYCSGNKLTTLDVSKNEALTALNCNENQIATLNINGCKSLKHLYCIANQLSTLNVANNISLIALWCYDNLLTSIDISENSALEELICTGNPYLTEIWLKSGQKVSVVYDNDVATIKYKN